LEASLGHHTKGTDIEPHELGLRLAKDTYDAFAHPKDTFVTFLQGSIGVGGTMAKAPNDR
jgi:hypothetical protein